LLNPHVAKLVVCNPRKNALLKNGNKSDRIDARKLAEFLRGKHLIAGLSWQDERAHAARTGLELWDHGKDLTRVMSRFQALYRSWSIPCAGRDLYYSRHWADWLGRSSIPAL
jgi:hypothetical protein